MVLADSKTLSQNHLPLQQRGWAFRRLASPSCLGVDLHWINRIQFLDRNPWKDNDQVYFGRNFLVQQSFGIWFPCWTLEFCSALLSHDWSSVRWSENRRLRLMSWSYPSCSWLGCAWWIRWTVSLWPGFMANHPAACNVCRLDWVISLGGEDWAGIFSCIPPPMEGFCKKFPNLYHGKSGIIMNYGIWG